MQGKRTQSSPRTGRASVIVLIGVSGCGKSTVGRLLAASLGAAFLEGDGYHPARSIALMRAGTPLRDSDRWPWLDKIAGAIVRRRRAGRRIVVACSALKRTYRERLERATRSRLTFVHLTLDPASIDHRLEARSRHFMPASLLQSQLAILEPLGPDETGPTIVTSGTARQTVAAIRRWLTHNPVRARWARVTKEGGRSRPPKLRRREKP